MSRFDPGINAPRTPDLRVACPVCAAERRRSVFDLDSDDGERPVQMMVPDPSFPGWRCGQGHRFRDEEIAKAAALAAKLEVERQALRGTDLADVGKPIHPSSSRLPAKIPGEHPSAVTLVAFTPQKPPNGYCPWCHHRGWAGNICPNGSSGNTGMTRPYDTRPACGRRYIRTGDPLTPGCTVRVREGANVRPEFAGAWGIVYSPDVHNGVGRVSVDLDDGRVVLIQTTNLVVMSQIT